MLDHLSMSRRLSTMVFPLPTRASPASRKHWYPLFSVNDMRSQVPYMMPPFILSPRPFRLMSWTSRSNQFIEPSGKSDASLRKFLILNDMFSSSTLPMLKISFSEGSSSFPPPSLKILFMLVVPEVSASGAQPLFSGSTVRKNSPSVTFAEAMLMLPPFSMLLMLKLAVTYLALNNVSTTSSESLNGSASRTTRSRSTIALNGSMWTLPTLILPLM